MSVQHTDERMNAITRMIARGEDVTYACGMFETPKSKYKLWLAGLSADTAIHSGEKHEAKAMLTKSTPQTKGHLQGSGGVRGHSAGNIFPYIIVLVGNFIDGFRYHITGNGLDWVTTKNHKDYAGAYDHALLCLEMDSLDDTVANLKLPT